MFSTEQFPSTFVLCGVQTQSLVNLPIATSAHPDIVCGFAHRVGYTHVGEGANAMYRLKVDVTWSPGKITLQRLFVLENGTFSDYEQWRSLHTMSQEIV